MTDPTVTSHLTDVIESLGVQRQQATQQLEHLRKQLVEAPKQIQQNIDGLERAIGQIDALRASAQVILTDQSVQQRVELQRQANACPLPAAANDGEAAGDAGLLGTAPAGLVGGAGMADQPGSSETNTYVSEPRDIPIEG